MNRQEKDEILDYLLKGKLPDSVKYLNQGSLKYYFKENEYIIEKFINALNGKENAYTTRIEAYKKVMNYIIIMQERFSQTDGYICCYCKKPWTFFRRPITRGIGHKKRGKASPETDSKEISLKLTPVATMSL